MFAQILYTQWKWTRLTLGAFIALAFLMPLAMWNLWGAAGESYSAGALMLAFERMGALLMAISVLGGFVLAVQPWAVDSLAKHVYPLSLPIPWSRYVALRFGAGAISLILPAIALWFGSLATLSLVELPPTMHAYAGTVAARFLLASLVTYAGIFALQYLSGRRAVVILLVMLLTFLVGSIILQLTGNTAIAAWLGRVLFEWPGPLSVFSADWSLVDV